MVRFNFSYVLDKFQLCQIVLFKPSVWLEKSVLIQFTNVVNKKEFSVMCESCRTGDRKKKNESRWCSAGVDQMSNTSSMVVTESNILGESHQNFEREMAEYSATLWWLSPDALQEVV